MNHITIRKIRKEDNPAIENIIKQVLTEHGVNKPGTAYYDSSLQHMFEFYSVPKSIYFIAEENNRIVGGGGIFPTDGLPADTCELVKMYLLPEMRGKGVGKSLIQTCLQFAKQAGYKRIYLETMNELSKAVKIYEKTGFELLTGPLGNTGHFACTIRMIKPLN
ncbi:MAG TPA: GNAT family N-acetyltransferase [Bacteroidia bacterium]|jgi:putative acetyltransferase|nr:GNAT family N-acetyltransferase [Bacteroidia bacterium]